MKTYKLGPQSIPISVEALGTTAAPVLHHRSSRRSNIVVVVQAHLCGLTATINPFAQKFILRFTSSILDARSSHNRRRLGFQWGWNTNACFLRHRRRFRLSSAEFRIACFNFQRRSISHRSFGGHRSTKRIRPRNPSVLHSLSCHELSQQKFGLEVRQKAVGITLAKAAHARSGPAASDAIGELFSSQKSQPASDLPME